MKKFKIFSLASLIIFTGLNAAATGALNQLMETSSRSRDSMFERIISLHRNGQLANLNAISKSKFASGRCFYQNSDKPFAAVLVIQETPVDDVGPIGPPEKKYRGIMSFDIFGQLPSSYFDSDGLDYEDLGPVQTEPIIGHDSKTYRINQEKYLEGGMIYLRANGSYVTALRHVKDGGLITACYFFKFH